MPSDKSGIFTIVLLLWQMLAYGWSVKDLSVWTDLSEEQIFAILDFYENNKTELSLYIDLMKYAAENPTPVHYFRNAGQI